MKCSICPYDGEEFITTSIQEQKVVLCLNCCNKLVNRKMQLIAETGVSTLEGVKHCHRRAYDELKEGKPFPKGGEK